MKRCLVWLALAGLLLVVASWAFARKGIGSTGRDSIDAELAQHGPYDAEDPPPTEEAVRALIASGPDAYTIHDYKRTALPFFEKILVEAYRKHGKRDPKWDKQAEDFLREWALTFIGAPGSLTSRDLLDRASAPLASGCEDPLIRGLHLPLMTRHQGLYTQREIIESFLVDTKEMGYPTLTRVLLADASAETIKTYGYKDLAECRDEVILEGTREILSEKPDKESDCRPIFAVLAAILSSRDKKRMEQLDEVCRKALKEGNGDAWLIHTVRGSININLAWAWRGGRWASEVTEEGWKGFSKHLQIADKDLRQAHQLHPDRPEAAAMMISIAGSGSGPGDESVYYWFRESLRAQMDYWPAYRRLHNFIQPKWGGSREAMFAVGVGCLKTKRYDTWVPMRFYETMYHLGLEEKPRFASWQLPGTESLFEELFEGYAKAPQVDPCRDFVLSRQAMVARRYGRYADALAVLGRLKDGRRLHLPTLQQHYIGRESLIRELHGRGGPAGSLIAQADEVYATGDLLKAHDLLQKALEKASDDRKAKLYLKGRLAGLAIEEKLKTGEWIGMTFDKNLTDWWIERGGAKRLDEKTVQGWSGIDGYGFSMLHFANLGHRFQFEAEGEIFQEYPGYDTTIIFCHAQDPVYRFRTFILLPQSGKAALRRDFVHGDMFPVKIYPKKNRMEVTVWDKEVALAVNGEVIHRSTWLRPDEVFGTIERIGLGSLLQNRNYKTTYSSLRVRGLKERPTLLDD